MTDKEFESKVKGLYLNNDNSSLPPRMILFVLKELVELPEVKGSKRIRRTVRRAIALWERADKGKEVPEEKWSEAEHEAWVAADLAWFEGRQKKITEPPAAYAAWAVIYSVKDKNWYSGEVSGAVPAARALELSKGGAPREKTFERYLTAFAEIWEKGNLTPAPKPNRDKINAKRSIIGENLDDWIASLKEVKEIFESAGIRYWCDLGTALGAVREGKLIGWDNDVDFFATIDEVPKMLALIPKFHAMGYRVDVSDSEVYLNIPGKVRTGLSFYQVSDGKIWAQWYKKLPKFNFIMKYLSRIAERIIYVEYDRGLPRAEEKLYRAVPKPLRFPLRKFLFGICHLFGERDYAMVFPRRMVNDGLADVTLYGIPFKVPNPPEEFVERIYGSDWRIPNKMWNLSRHYAIDFDFFREHCTRANYFLFDPRKK